MQDGFQLRCVRPRGKTRAAVAQMSCVEASCPLSRPLNPSYRLILSSVHDSRYAAVKLGQVCASNFEQLFKGRHALYPRPLPYVSQGILGLANIRLFVFEVGM